MTSTLVINRYNQPTPTHIQPNGCSVSTPIYVCPTTDQNKALLNAFRDVVRKQRREMGFDNTNQSIGVTVTTATVPPMTQAETDLGMTEDTLRYALFQRRGTPERLIVKLQQITGVELITRAALQQTFDAWLDSLELKDEKKGTQRTRKTSKKSASSTSATTNDN